MKNEYMGTGLVSDMTFAGVLTSGTVDALTGAVTKDYNHGRGSVKVGGNYMLNDESPVIVDAIMIPRAAYDEQASVSFVIDGQKHTYAFPVQHEWKAGMKYTYTLKMTGNYNAPVNKEQVDIDVEYWGQYGKTDDMYSIRIRKITSLPSGPIIRSTDMTATRMKARYSGHSITLGAALRKVNCVSCS